MIRTIAEYTLLGLMLAPAFAVCAADDPPADAASTVAADAKAVGTAVKRDAKAVANAAKESAQQVAEAAKGVAHGVATAGKQGAQEVAAAAKRGAKKTKAAVTPRKAAGEENTAAGNPDSKPNQ